MKAGILVTYASGRLSFYRLNRGSVTVQQLLILYVYFLLLFAWSHGERTTIGLWFRGLSGLERELSLKLVQWPRIALVEVDQHR